MGRYAYLQVVLGQFVVDVVYSELGAHGAADGIMVRVRLLVTR